MIKDKLENIGRYSVNEFFESFKSSVARALNFPENLEAPLKAIPLEYETKDFDLSKFENHEKNIDVHFIIEGSEQIGVSQVNNLVSNIPYNDEGDYQLFGGKVEETFILRKGEFLLLFPGETHLTGGKVNGKGNVKKMVYKIPIK